MKNILMLVVMAAFALLIPSTSQAQTCETVSTGPATWIGCNLYCESQAEACCPGQCRRVVAEWDWMQSQDFGICSCDVWCAADTPLCGGSGGGGGGGSGGDECDDNQDCVATRGEGWVCILPYASYSWCEEGYLPN